MIKYILIRKRFCGVTGTFEVKKLLKNTLIFQRWDHSDAHAPSAFVFSLWWKETMITRCQAAADVGWHVSLSLSLSSSSFITFVFLLSIYRSSCRLPSAGYNNLEVAEYLLEHGADVNAQDKGGLIPLHNAASYGVRRTNASVRVMCIMWSSS